MQHMRRTIGHADQGDPRSHAVDRESDVRAQHLREIFEVRGHVLARRIQVVKRHEGRSADVSRLFAGVD